MKTSVLLAVVGLVAVVAVAGVALASGSVDKTYGTQASDPSGRGMMGNHMGGIDADHNGYQHMYQYRGNGSYGCSHDNDWNYSWDWDHDYGGCPCMD